MILYLERRGCDFRPNTPECRESDLGNYRLALEFIARDGRRICGDIVRGSRHEKRKNKKGQEVYELATENALHSNLQYENHTGCFVYHIEADFTPDYTRADALRYINSVSAVQYEAVEVVDCLPPEAHEYPESVLELERAYLAADHAELYEETAQKIRDTPRVWIDGLSWSFRRMTPGEYKSLTLLAFEITAKTWGVLKIVPERVSPAALVWHHMTKHFFEEQNFVEPYADSAFLAELEKLSPCYVGRYLAAMTPDEFAAMLDA